MTIIEQVVHLLKNKEYDEATKKLIQAIEENPNNPLYYVNLGNIFYEQKYYTEAENFLLKAIELDDTMATAFHSLGSMYYSLGKYSLAEPVLKQAVQLQIKEAEAYYLLGMVYVKQNNLLLSLPYLQRATEMQSYIPYLFQYALVLAETNHYEEAEKLFKDLLQQNPTHADSLYNLGVIKQIYHHNSGEAKHLFKKALSANPNHILAKNSLREIEKG